MTIETCNGYLAVVAALNEGSDHACQYTLAALEESAELKEAIAREIFGSDRSDLAKKIELLPVAAPWRGAVEAAVFQWFFVQAYSPSTQGDLVQRNVVIGFLEHLSHVVGNADVFEVGGEAIALGWAVVWQGFIFCSGSRRWLLQFGWHD
ncbi:MULTISPECIES: hypothetical protein [unclassified Roseateles]|uniref:hypothetical protein n=1 Tax=Pelomonas sp. Root1237 TaxID=1736434 RepID=UPI0012FB3006|nr:hypothetical protein [Pelomonas sp. Root1237]